MVKNDLSIKKLAMRKLILPAVFSLVLILMAFKEFNTLDTDLNRNNLEASEPSNGLVVLELFTSQGCSSCPPADVLLEKVQKLYPENVLALSYHVDYWNYIGWEDPFSSNNYTKKQRAYNIKFESRSNYTPQLVINGREHLVGSHKAKILEKIELYKKLTPLNPVSFKVKKMGNKLFFNYDVNGDLEHKVLRIITVLNERITKVNRGENRNRSLKNSNIVVGEKFIKTISGKGEGVIEIPAIIAETDEVSLFLLVQDKNLEITGGTKLALKN